MAGHSKWNNIKRKKEKTDAQRAKIFTKIGREISVAVREGGGDPSVNGKLRDVIAKAKSNNVPNENIERIIKKAAGGDGDSYEEIVYEGYGPSGTAVIVEALTDNRNRTAGDLRHYFDKYGGNLGQNGCVMFLFERKGVILIESAGVNEDELTEKILESGAEDMSLEEGVFEILTTPAGFSAVLGALDESGYSFLSAEIEYIPVTETELSPEDTVKMEKLLDILEDSDDVQKVWHNGILNEKKEH